MTKKVFWTFYVLFVCAFFFVASGVKLNTEETTDAISISSHHLFEVKTSGATRFVVHLHDGFRLLPKKNKDGPFDFLEEENFFGLTFYLWRGPDWFQGRSVLVLGDTELLVRLEAPTLKFFSACAMALTLLLAARAFSIYYGWQQKASVEPT